MAIFSTEPCHLEAPYPPQVTLAAIEKGYDIQRHGELHHTGIFPDKHTRSGSASWWYAEDLTAEPSIVPDGWTVLVTSAYFEIEQIDTEDQARSIALELQAYGIVEELTPFRHDGVFRDANGEFRSRWFADLRGQQPTPLQELAKAVAEHLGAAQDMAQGNEAGEDPFSGVHAKVLNDADSDDTLDKHQTRSDKTARSENAGSSTSIRAQHQDDGQLAP